MHAMKIILGLLPFVLTTVAMAQTVTVTFNDQEVGKPPKGFSTALTGGGKMGTWIIVSEKQDSSRVKVLAQTDMDPTGYRFPLCIYDEFIGKDVDISVKFKPLKGKKDQAAGIVWRYKDKDNYYIVRVNALENNVVLYKVEKGKRSDLPLVGKGRTYGEKINVPSGSWGTLRVVAKGDRFETYLNGTKLFEVTDTTFPDAGKVGLWTKADSYTLFDDLTMHSLGK
jgi:hypothetical protein